jgi:DUF1680 family protein
MAYRPLPDASFIRAEGDLDDRFRRALRRLTEGPEYTEEFVLSDVTGAFWRVFTEYAGDISGRYLGAVALGRTYTREPCPRVDEIARGVVEAQREDGHFNLDQPLDRIYFPLVYGHGRLLQGLVEYQSVAPDSRILIAIRRLAGYFCAIAPYWRAPDVVANEEFIYYTQAIEGVVGAYGVTGEARYRDLAAEMAGLLWNEPKHHSHSYLSSLLGILALYEATGEEKWLKFVELKRDAIAGMVTVDGGVTEMLPNKHVTEFCSVADWFMLNLRLWRATGQTRYLEQAEKTLLNAVYFNQFSTGGFGTWNCDREIGYPGRVEVGSGEAYWCCCFHGVRALYDALTHAYTWDEDGVQVNLFFPGTVRLPQPGDLTIRQETDYPQAGRVRLCVSAPGKSDVLLRLRVPTWARDPRLALNGEPVPAGVDEAGYVAVKRAWGNADVLELTFEMGLRLEDGTGPVDDARLAPGKTLDGVSLWWGPLLLALDEIVNAKGPSDEKRRWTVPSHLRLPPPREGVFVLHHAASPPLSVPWPDVVFEVPAVTAEDGSDRRPVPVVLTPLARTVENQPPCAPSTRTRYSVEVMA